MLKKRIIVCLDVKDGRTTKGVKFLNNVAIGQDLAVMYIRDLITPYLENQKLLQVDIRSLQKELATLPWIENVAVVRDFPDILRIVIKSKEVIAYKIIGEKL